MRNSKHVCGVVESQGNSRRVSGGIENYEELLMHIGVASGVSI